VLLATLVGTPWTDYKRRIKDELEVLSHSLVQIFEHSVHLSRASARLAMLARFPSWCGFVATADYALKTVSRLVEEMTQLENAEDGLLHQMMANGIRGEVLQRIVVDLILAAGDTVSQPSHFFHCGLKYQLCIIIICIPYLYSVFVFRICIPGKIKIDYSSLLFMLLAWVHCYAILKHFQS
jgi:hypothetical protein